MAEEKPEYECRCESCHQSFFAESKHRVICPACLEQEMADRGDDHLDDDTCQNCGGEGFVSDCFDGLCADAEIGCDDCTRPCSECHIRNKAA